MLTARFILHIRHWEGKDSHSTSVNSNPSEVDFQRNLSSNGLGTVVNSTIHESFGSDPVARATAEKTIQKNEEVTRDGNA